jgi:hypothetical protein
MLQTWGSLTKLAQDRQEWKKLVTGTQEKAVHEQYVLIELF